MIQNGLPNEQARNYARSLRSQYQAVLVGVNTVIYDDPHLGARAKGKYDPLRIILDSTLRTPPKSQVLRNHNVLIVTTQRSTQAQQRIFVDQGIPLLVLPTQDMQLAHVLKELAKREIMSVFVRGW